MKKLYSLFAAVAITATVSAQGTENFNSQSATAGTSYSTITFTNAASNTNWNLTLARLVDTTANYNIEGTSALLNTNGTITITFPQGVGTLNFDYRKAFTGAATRNVEISVNGTVVSTSAGFGAGSGAQTTVYSSSTVINSAASTTVTIKALGGQTTFDNFSWTANGVLAVTDVNSVKSNFVRNTVAEDFVNFGAKSDVKVYNMNGQLVKSASVSETRNLQVSELTPGIYVVTGTVNGQAVSQKITKK